MSEGDGTGKGLVRKLSFSESDSLPTATDSAPERMKVFVRLRPSCSNEEQSAICVTDSACSISISNQTAQGATETKEHCFSFDGVFTAESNQQQVYDVAMHPQVQALQQGRDTLTFAYGITNAGKTYTIRGGESLDERGVLPRALEELFESLRQHKEHHDGNEPAPGGMLLDPACKYEVRASFLEVYSNDVYDLLAPPERGLSQFFRGNARRKLQIKDTLGRAHVDGLKEVELPDLTTALEAMQMAWQNRQSASNGINGDSSRSHAVLCIKLMCSALGSAVPSCTRLNLVDLAGSERQKNTNSSGARFTEANKINNDLMVLGRCLHDLRWNQTHPKANQKVMPFREAQISKLFRDYLSGQGQTVVIASVNPRAADATSTLETLKFAAVAQQIKCLPPVYPMAPPQPRAAAKRNRVRRSESATSDSQRSSNGSSTHAATDVFTLQEQVCVLQQRLEEMEGERIAVERRIRDEVYDEMQRHISETDEAMKQRLAEAQFSTEDAYYEKLQLVKSNSARVQGEVSAAAHQDMVQQFRDSEVGAASLRAKCVTLQQELCATQSALLDAQEEVEALRNALRPCRAGGDTEREAEVEREREVRAEAEARTEAEARAEAELEEVKAELEEVKAELLRAKAELEGARAAMARVDASGQAESTRGAAAALEAEVEAEVEARKRAEAAAAASDAGRARAEAALGTLLKEAALGTLQKEAALAALQKEAAAAAEQASQRLLSAEAELASESDAKELLAERVRQLERQIAASSKQVRVSVDPLSEIEPSQLSAREAKRGLGEGGNKRWAAEQPKRAARGRSSGHGKEPSSVLAATWPDAKENSGGVRRVSKRQSPPSEEDESDVEDKADDEKEEGSPAKKSRTESDEKQNNALAELSESSLKPSQLKQLRSQNWPGKKNDTEFADLARLSSKEGGGKGGARGKSRGSMPKPRHCAQAKAEPTPIARRTRGARRSEAAV